MPTEPTAEVMDTLTREVSDVDEASHYDELRRRCSEAKIAFEERPGFEGGTYLILQLPNGRDQRPVPVVSGRDAKRLLEVPFERLVFLGNYLATADYSDGSIEAVIRANTQAAAANTMIYRRLFGVDPFGRSSPPELKPIELTPPQEGAQIRISMGTMSRALQALTDRRVPRLGSPSLRITNTAVKTHDAAVALLERVSNALFFDLDLKLNLPLALAKERRRIVRGRPLPNDVEPGDITFPTYEYAAEPMALYWYARSAAGMPLLQFLAFYQCLEFFFPIYSKAEMQRRVRNILKDPSFQARRDRDIARILQAAEAGRGVGDERSQLRNTILECVDPAELRAFIAEAPERANFLAKDKTVSDRRIPTSSSSTDIRNELVERIYDIRCKIVHTKVGGGESAVDLLLPFSKEAEALDHDIDVIQYLARRVLVASGVDLVL